MTADGTGVLIQILEQDQYPNLEASLDRAQEPQLQISANRKDLLQCLKSIETITAKEYGIVDLALNNTKNTLDLIFKSDLSAAQTSSKITITKQDPENPNLDSRITVKDFQNVLDQGNSEEVELNFYNYGINTSVLGIREIITRTEKIQKEIEEVGKDNTIQTKQVTEQVPLYNLQAEYIIMLHRPIKQNVQSVTTSSNPSPSEEPQSEPEPSAPEA